MKMLKGLMTLAVPLGIVIGCASGGEMDAVEAGAAMDGEGVAVEVENNLIPSTSLTVWMVSRTGTRNMLGTVSPGETDVLTTTGLFDGDYRLMAETTAGEELWSNSFYVGDTSDTVTWDMNANIVTMGG